MQDAPTSAAPGVITTRLLLEGVDAAAAAAAAATGGSDGALALRGAVELSLSFQQLLSLEGLETLLRLETLRADNNLLSRLSGVATLTRLRWLDLSFNRIAAVEGLASLVLLEDLSLFSNELATLGGGLDGLTRLQCLSLGNNCIEELAEVGEGRARRARARAPRQCLTHA